MDFLGSRAPSLLQVIPVIEEFIKSSLKNKCAYACKHGYFVEMTKLDVASDKDKEEDTDNEEDGEDGEDAVDVED